MSRGSQPQEARVVRCGTTKTEQVPGATVRSQRDRSSRGGRRRAGVHRFEGSHSLPTGLVKGHHPVWRAGLLALARRARQVLVGGHGDRCFVIGVHCRLEARRLEQDALVEEVHRHCIAAALSVIGNDPPPLTVELRPCGEAFHAHPRALGEDVWRLFRQHACCSARLRGLAHGQV
eukprot:scaffold10350_cov68-Phaeocystis_antarctica.AAC.8